MKGQLTRRILAALAVAAVTAGAASSAGARADAGAGAGAGAAPRIVGGQPAEASEYPWMAVLVDAKAKSRFRGFYCGGALIAPRRVVSAAHCITATGNNEPREFDVVVGASNLGRRDSRRFDVSGITLLPTTAVAAARDEIPLRGDVALITLARPSKAKPIPVVNRQQGGLWQQRDELTAIGFGLTRSGGPASRKLLEVSLERRLTDRCERDFDTFVRGAMLCAGGTSVGVCYGDSGGPLFARTRDGRPVLVGITSYGGARCARRPGVFAAARRYRDFFLSKRPPTSPVHTRDPAIRGRLAVGSRVTCEKGAWRGESIRFRYVWGVRRERRIGNDIFKTPVLVVKDLGKRLRLTAEHRGEQLACGVIALNRAGSVDAVSAFQGPVRG